MPAVYSEYALELASSPVEWGLLMVSAMDEFIQAQPGVPSELLQVQRDAFKLTVGMDYDNLLYAQGFIKAAAGVVLAEKGSTPSVKHISLWGKYTTLADLGLEARLILASLLRDLTLELLA